MLELARTDRLKAAVNCAGSVFLKPAHLTTPDEFRQVLLDNLWTSYAVVRGASRALYKTGGSVVLCLSAAAAIGIPNHEAIAAAKAAVEGLARSAAATYAARGLRMNVVAPGLVETEATASITNNEASLHRSTSMHAIGRIGQPDEVADMICWLADAERSGWVTGQVFRIDGGLSSVISRR
jgi:NAD(P)-dependent dehydrogenase (short-subunit alcohol dehydrogenase family)